ncbi:YeeE/YedE family protein [Roseateles albus]|uniref:YeeE/YedE family protein n=1 Tax=Roseateles albus TaxID=2987525 RepID=UPI0023593A47
MTPKPQPGVALAALAVVVLLGISIARHAPGRHVLLMLTGVALGGVLYQSVFGFTSAFRVLLASRRSAGFRAQMVMLGVACLLFFPVLVGGTLWGQPVIGFLSPVGVSLMFGAFIFGIGMQLGGGCASGTLYALGGGSTRMLVTLLFFIVGSVVGVTHLAWWERLPALEPVSLITGLGWPLALALNLAVFAAAYCVAWRLERARHGSVVSIATLPSMNAGAGAAPGVARAGATPCVSGPWPLLTGALALALLNFVTLAGRPWGITSAYGLWGGMLLQSVGVPITGWSGYSSPEMQAALHKGALADITSVMDFGIMLGALLAAGAAGKFKPVWRISGGHFAASVVGGLLLGYGARLAYGCNIGAFFSGIASGSLHGWLWIVFALVGTWAGLHLRPVFGLSDVPPSKH